MNQNKHLIAMHAWACEHPVRLTFHRILFALFDGKFHRAKVVFVTRTILSEVSEQGDFSRRCDMALSKWQIWRGERKRTTYFIESVLFIPAKWLCWKKGCLSFAVCNEKVFCNSIFYQTPGCEFVDHTWLQHFLAHTVQSLFCENWDTVLVSPIGLLTVHRK